MPRTDGNYSVRSRASWKRQIILLAEQKKLQTKKAIIEQEMTKVNEDIRRLRGASLTVSDGMVDYNLQQALAARDGKLAHMKDCDEGIREREEEIARLEPSEVQRAERAELQGKLGARVEARAATDRKIGATLDTLRTFLAEHQQQTTGTREAAIPVEITPPNGSFDAGRLLSLLPDGVGETSEREALHFLGRPKGGKPYIVRSEYLCVAETLAHHGIYRFGETIVLAPDEAAELLASDYAAPTRATPWRRVFARVMSVEEFERTRAEAVRRRVEPFQLVFEADVRQDFADREFYRNNLKSPVSRKLAVSADGEDALPSSITVAVRALRNIGGPRKDEMHAPGTVVEAMALKDAWELVANGAAGPL